MLYHFEKHSGQVVLLEGHSLCISKRVICLIQRDETFKNGKEYEDKDFHLAIEEEVRLGKMTKKVAWQGFIFHAIIPALNPFW